MLSGVYFNSFLVYIKNNNRAELGAGAAARYLGLIKPASHSDIRANFPMEISNRPRESPVSTDSSPGG